MFESLKNRHYTKKDALIGVTIGLVVMLAYGVSDYNPGIIQYSDVPEADKAQIAEFSKLAGPQQSLTVKGDKPLQRQPTEKPKTTKVPSLLPNPASLPSTMPSFTQPPKVKSTTPKTNNNTSVYARHASLTEGMKTIINPSFELKKFSDAPKADDDRFTTSFEYSKNGTSLEKFELMSIVRSNKMQGIKTARQALDALIEENSSVNILEENDSYLIYDFAGSGGYQIGKIAIDEMGIYIFGYINLTTNEMPSSLKSDWMEKLKNLN